MADPESGAKDVQVEQEKLAAEWAAMAEEDGDAAGEEEAASSVVAGRTARPTRILNQGEIDSLLGFDDTHDKDEGRPGLQAILSSTLVSYERLPMLEVVFDRLVRLMSTSLRNFTSDNVEVSLDNISSTRFGDYLNAIPLPAIIGVFMAEEWDNLGLITVDSALIYSVVDVLLGGRRDTVPMLVEGRPYTTIERNLVEKMIHVVLADMSTAFEPLSPVTFRFERLETNPRFASIARPANAGVVFKMRVDMEERGGRFEVLLPYATLEPIRELLLQMFVGEKFGRDPIWETHLATELWSTKVEIEAVLDEQFLPLREVTDLKVGTTLMLNVAPDSSVLLRCGDVPMLAARMGRVGQNIAVRVESSFRNGDQAS